MVPMVPMVPLVSEPLRMSKDDEDTSEGCSCLQWLSRPRGWWDGDCTNKNEVNEDLMKYNVGWTIVKRVQ